MVCVGRPVPATPRHQGGEDAQASSAQPSELLPSPDHQCHERGIQQCHPGFEVRSPRLPVLPELQNADPVLLRKARPQAAATLPLKSRKNPSGRRMRQGNSFFAWERCEKRLIPWIPSQRGWAERPASFSPPNHINAAVGCFSATPLRRHSIKSESRWSSGALVEGDRISQPQPALHATAAKGRRDSQASDRWPAQTRARAGDSRPFH